MVADGALRWKIRSTTFRASISLLVVEEHLKLKVPEHVDTLGISSGLIHRSTRRVMLLAEVPHQENQLGEDS